MLEAIYESGFSVHSHGFRPSRSCHTCLAEVKRTFTGVKWFMKHNTAQMICLSKKEYIMVILRSYLGDIIPAAERGMFTILVVEDVSEYGINF